MKLLIEWHSNGVQIVGKPWDEKSVFEIGAAIEILQPWKELWMKINIE